MPESVENRQIFTLTEVANSIRKTISDRYTSSYWIKAEINKLNSYAKSGHCFPELVYKNNGIVECEMRATLWKTDYDRINRIFLKELNEPLKDGIKVLMLASIQYEPKYGLSLIIRDIDPSYSMGELEREKKETIEKLQREGLFGKNKLVSLSLLPQRIAVISIETSKGYQDFVKVIDQNIFGYHFFHMLFPAVLQGDASIKTIKAQLNRIKKVRSHFDAVAIIRGGGGDVGLSSFNNYQLAKAICNFPLPVFTGIGHSTNLTVSEMVAYQSAITPTELGDFLLQRFHNVAVPLQRSLEIILAKVPEIIELENRQFSHTVQLFKAGVKQQLTEQKNELATLSREVVTESKVRMQSEKKNLLKISDDLKKSGDSLVKNESRAIATTHADLIRGTAHFFKSSHDQIKTLEKMVNLVDPMNVVKRGYTLTTANGKLVRSLELLQPGDEMETLTSDGTITSKITKLHKSSNHE